MNSRLSPQVFVPQLIKGAPRRVLCRRGHTQGYKAMGSFHSDNVDDLMSQSDGMYTPPLLPFDITPGVANDNIQDFISQSNTSSDFMLDRETWTFLNHGAFGAALRVGYDRAAQWRYHLEQQPLRYFDRDLLPHLVYSARRLADFCQAPVREGTTLIPNVTFGLNSILRGYAKTYGNDAHVILWDTSYGSLKKIAHQCCNKVTEIPLSNYFDRWGNARKEGPEEDIFQSALEETIDSSEQSKSLENALLILDHTTSNTAINMPLQSLSRIAKEQKMLVMVDGAHGLLAQQVSLETLPHVDSYVANGHKWLSCPRGIGMLYCPSKSLQDTVLAEPAVMSHGMGQGFQTRFLWDGCRDYAAALSVPAVLDYWRSRNLEQVQKDLESKLHQAVHLLGRAWHGRETGVTLAPLDIHSPMMALVRLPDHLQKHPTNATSADAKVIQDFLYENYVEVPIKDIRGILYVRISCHVYNEISEYETLASTLAKYRQ
jgi:isopenicillin-N epimerase